MAAQASALHLQLEEIPQAVASQDAGSRERTWFVQGMGLAALMLIGVYSMGGLGFQRELPSGSEKLSGHDAAFAFLPVVPGIRDGGIRPFKTPAMSAGRRPLSKRMTMLDPPKAKIIANGNVQGEQQAMSEATLASKQQYLAKLTAGSGDSGSSVSSMSMLATTAMASAGDPGQLASVFTVMPQEDKKKVEMLTVDVLAKAKSLPGVTAPFGFFDPLGFCSDCSDGKLCFYREVEVKHGRVAMLASLGFLVGEHFHPLFGGNIDVASYIAFQQTPLQQFWPAVVAAIAIPELLSTSTFRDITVFNWWTVKPDRDGGDLGFDPLGLKPKDPKKAQRHADQGAQ